MTIVHKIDENSPLYELGASDLKEEEFEIVVLLEGVIESTGEEELVVAENLEKHE